MSHWTDKYLGANWTDEFDCFYWFRQIQKHEFGFDVLPCNTFAEKRAEYRQWVEVPNGHDAIDGGEGAIEGDAVWMTMHGEPHHIGTWTGSCNGVIHAVNGQGVVHDSVYQLLLAGWTIERFERHV